MILSSMSYYCLRHMLITYSSFDPLTPSSVHTNLQALTHIPSYPSPLVTSFNPALTYMIEPMNIDLYFLGSLPSIASLLMGSLTLHTFPSLTNVNLIHHTSMI